MKAIQDWVENLSVMQQSVLLTAIRGPDGLHKNHVAKVMLRWYRRCILISAFDKCTLDDPYDPRGGSFTGPCNYISPRYPDHSPNIAYAMEDYIRTLDEVPHHFQLHFMHACEILGYKHPDTSCRDWWRTVYENLVSDMHLYPETEAALDRRLGDSETAWRDAEIVTAD